MQYPYGDFQIKVLKILYVVFVLKLQEDQTFSQICFYKEALEVTSIMHEDAQKFT